MVSVSCSRGQKYYLITLFNSPRCLEFWGYLACMFLIWVHGSLATEPPITGRSKFYVDMHACFLFLCKKSIAFIMLIFNFILSSPEDIFFIAFRERERKGHEERERERERCGGETLMWEKSSGCLLILAQTRNQACDLGICSDWESNPWPFGPWDDVPTNWGTPARALASPSKPFLTQKKVGTHWIYSIFSYRWGNWGLVRWRAFPRPHRGES